MIDELIERVEKGEGADRELDWDVLSATLAKGEGYAWDPKRGHEYTASLDAVLALIGEKMPGWTWEGGAVGGRRGWCAMCDPDGRVHVGANAASPARALLAAALRAHKEQHDGR